MYLCHYYVPDHVPLVCYNTLIVLYQVTIIPVTVIEVRASRALQVPVLRQKEWFGS